MGEPLARLGDIKSELGICSHDFDKQLRRLLLAASDAICAYVGYDLSYQVRTGEIHKADGAITLVTKNAPLLSVQEIRFRDDPIDNTNDAEYIIANAKGGIIQFCRAKCYSSTRRPGIANRPMRGDEQYLYEVDYTSGYVTAEQEAKSGGALVRTLPFDIEQAAIDWVSYAFGTRGSVGDIKSEKIGDASVSYGTSGSTGLIGKSGLPTKTESKLRKYKRTCVV